MVEEKNPDDALLNGIRISPRNSSFDRISVCRSALTRGANPSAKTPDGISALHWACWGKHSAVVRLLLDSRANPFELSPDKQQTCLHWACLSGDILSVRYLIQAGADIHQKDFQGFCALHFAAQQDRLPVIDYLFLNGANLEAPGYEGRTALHCAMELNKEKAVFLLLHLGANFSALDDYGRFPLHLAIERANYFLVRHVAHNNFKLASSQIFVKDKRNESPMDVARRVGHKGLIGIMESLDSKLQKLWMNVCFYPDGVSKGGLFMSTWTVSWIVIWQLHHIFVIFPRSPYALWFHMCIWMLTTIALISWSFCRFSDPGFIPMRPLPTLAFASAIASKPKGETDHGLPNSSGEKDSVIEVNERDGVKQQIPFSIPGSLFEWSEAYEQSLAMGSVDNLCVFCRVVQPLRANHCRHCRRCVMRFDHHCPFIDNCVGVGNHRAFLAFVFSISSVAVLYIWSIYGVFEAGTLEIYGSIMTIVFALHATLMGIFVIGLGCYHCSLVTRNSTTYENMRPLDQYLSVANGNGISANQFDRGCFSNWWTIITGDHGQALTLSRRAILTAYKSLFPDSTPTYPSPPLSKDDIGSRVRSSRVAGNGVEISHFTSESSSRTVIDLSKAKNT